MTYCRVAAATNNVLAGKEPVPPAEAADVLEKSQVQDSGAGIFAAVLFDTDFISPRLNVLQELAVRLGTVAPEVLENVRERVLRHGDLQQIIEQRDDRIVGSRLPAERHGLLVVLALVDDAVGEHGLVGDAEDESAVLDVVFGSAVGPHGLHGCFDALHRVKHVVESHADVFRAGFGGDGVEHVDCAFDEVGGVLDHVDVGQDEACFRRSGIETVFEGAD